MTTLLSRKLRRWIPPRVTRTIKQSRLYVRHRSSAVNIYHCCVHKTASQWVRRIFSDARTYRFCGLTPYTYQQALPGRFDPRVIQDRTFAEPFPERTIVMSIYIGFENYRAIPKPERHKAFFIMRDPRDLVVSWYFSMKRSHALMGTVPQIRETLNAMPLDEGILYSIGYLEDEGTFAALRSWVGAPEADPRVLLLRFEDLTSADNFQAFKRLFDHCDIRTPESTLRQMLHDHRFETLSGRTQGKEDPSSHYRKGAPGDWKNYFDDDILATFKAVTGDLVTYLGYERGHDW